MNIIKRKNLHLLAGAILATGLAVSTTLSADSSYSPIMPQAALISATAPVSAIAKEESAHAEQADVLMKSAWRSADPAIFSRIATAFETDALDGADLVAVECRASLCKIRFETEADLAVAKLLPMQLATTFHAIVTVHDTGSNNVVYMDVPVTR
ncbi:MAG: hypothetical protein AAGI24_02750 [Pseudomonadota bacterium]